MAGRKVYQKKDIPEIDRSAKSKRAVEEFEQQMEAEKASYASKPAFAPILEEAMPQATVTPMPTTNVASVSAPIQRGQHFATTTHEGSKPPPHYVYIHMKNKTKAGGHIFLRNHDGRHPIIDRSGNEIEVYGLNMPVTKLDYNDPADRSIIENARSQPAFYLSRAESLRLYSIEDLEVNAQEEIDTLESALDAGIILKSKSQEERNEFARLFGINPDVRTPTRTYAELIDIAKKNPAEIIRMEKDPDRDLRQVMRRAEMSATSKVVKRNGNYYYGNEVMGSTFEQVIDWAHRNPDLIMIIKRNSQLPN